jgi:hypothetical protein
MTDDWQLASESKTPPGHALDGVKMRTKVSYVRQQHYAAAHSISNQARRDVLMNVAET